MDEFKKLETQNFHQYIWAMDELVQSGKYKNWKEITPFVNRELFGDDESQYRDESAYRKAVKYARDFYEAGVFGDSEDEYYKKLENEFLISKIIDKINFCKNKNSIEYTDFLDMYQISVVQEFLKKINIEKINDLLHQFGEYIVGRMGIPYRDKKISIISVAVDAPQNEISALSGKIGKLSGVSIKTAYSGVITDE